MEQTSVPRSDPSAANTALGVSLAALAVYVVLVATDHDGPGWPIVGVLGAIGAFLGWRAGGGARPTGRALAATIVGGLLFLSILGWIVVAVITGDWD